MLDPIKKYRILTVIILLIIGTNTLFKWYPNWISFCILIPIMVFIFYKTLLFTKTKFGQKH